MKRLFDIAIDQVHNKPIKDGFEIIRDALVAEPFLNGSWRFTKIEFTKNGTFDVGHGLGFKPLDVIQSGVSGTGTVAWNHDSFTTSNLNLTVSGIPSGGTLTVRAFIGAYREDR